jgi:alpha-1,2-mannosyltransferase
MSMPRARLRLATTARPVPCWLPQILAGGLLAAAIVAAAAHVRPESPIDLRVYLTGARALLAGDDVTAAHLPGTGLYFTYPPFAALLFVPLLGPSVATASLLMTVASIAALITAIRLSLRQVRPQWTPAATWLVTLALSVGAYEIEPVRHTIDLGQVNLLLLALVLADLLAPPEWRLRGALVGLAAGIKLTPAVFVLYLLVTRQFRAARTAVGTSLVTIAIGLGVAPAATVRFWTGLVADPNHVGGIPYAGNQSIYAVTTRLGHGQAPLRWVWMLAAVAVVLVGLTTARRVHESGHELGAVSLIGLTGLLISPVSWDHHWVWVVPAVIALASLHRWLPAAGLVALFVVAPIWRVPRGGNVEFEEHGWQLLVGNAYVVAGVAILVVAAVWVRWSPVRAAYAVGTRTGLAGGTGLPAQRSFGGLFEGGEKRLGKVRRQVVADEQFVLGFVRSTEPDGSGS